jgi:hypothetical protein
VKAPVRSPAPRSSASARRTVEPFPFEPATWIGRSAFSGLPMRARSARIGSSVKRARARSAGFS